MDAKNPVSKAIRIVGSVTGLAAACGVKYQAVQRWRKRGMVPAPRVLAVERATGGKVTRYELRPDVFVNGDSPSV